MGWIEKVKSITCSLKASGKSKKEIEQIVQQAAEKATVGGRKMRMEMLIVPGDGFADMNMTDRWIWLNGMNVVANGYEIKAQDAVDAFTYAVAAQARYKARTKSNNWRKMHGLPMRRKRRARR